MIQVGIVSGAPMEQGEHKQLARGPRWLPSGVTVSGGSSPRTGGPRRRGGDLQPAAVCQRIIDSLPADRGDEVALFALGLNG
jgi:hypothetical protein